MYCRPAVSFESKNWEINGKTVLEIIVPKSERKPHFAVADDGTWKVYIRSEDQIFPGNNILIKTWKARKRKIGTMVRFTKKEKILLDYLLKNELPLLQTM